LQAVILAAGKGKRLQPLTTSISKGLLPIAGKPMVTRILEGLLTCNISDVVLVISPKDNQIQSYYEENPIPGVNIQFVTQAQPLGMANALAYASPLVHDDFLLSACDNLIPHFYMREMCLFWRNENNLDALLALMRITQEQAGTSSVVKLNDCWVERIIEKPQPHQIISLVSSIPLYFFTNHIFHIISEISQSPRGEYELQDAIQALISRHNHVRGFMIPVRYNLTSPVDYLEMNLIFLENESLQFIHPTCQIASGCQLVAPYFIEEDVIVEEGVTLGPKVYIKKNSRIGKKSLIVNSVLFDHAVVEPETTCSHQLIYGGNREEVC
jgi:dTDP-glucose pyrophosphorylase